MIYAWSCSIAVHAILCLALAAAGLILDVDTAPLPQIAEAQQIINLFFLVLSAWCFFSWYNVTRRVFDPYTLFLLAFILFHGGQVILEVFALNTRFLPHITSEISMVKAVYLAAVGIAALHLGGLIGAQSLKKLTVPRAPVSSKAAELVGIGFITVTIVPFIFITKESVIQAIGGGYFSLYQRESAVGVDGMDSPLSIFLIPGAFLLFGSTSQKGRRLFAVALLVVVAILKLVQGSRNPAAMILLSLLWLHHQLIRPLPRWLLTLCAPFLLLVFFVVGAVRNEAGSARFSLSTITEYLRGPSNPLLAPIAEMGGSLETVAWTIELVPLSRPHARGTSYLQALLTVVPNFWSRNRHPALDIGGWGLPGDWLVWEVDPHFARLGGSYGYSGIAEAYLNFGWLGAPFVMLIIGLFFARWVERTHRSDDPLDKVTLAIFVAFCLFFSRSSAQVLVRPLFWYVLLPRLIIKQISKLRRFSYPPTSRHTGVISTTTKYDPLAPFRPKLQENHRAHASTARASMTYPPADA